MRKVHWSVWGLLGFFGMLVVGLWIDAHWLPGVGFVRPATVPPLPIRQIQELLDTTPVEGDPAGAADPFQADATTAWDDKADPFQADATAAWDDKQVIVGASAPETLGGGLETLTDEPAAELLPEPETEGIPSASRSPSIPDAPPARDPALTSEPVRSSTSEAKSPAPPPSGADDRDGPIGAIYEWAKSSRVMNSKELAPDAQSRAQYLRELTEAVDRIRELDRAAAPPDLLPPPRSPLDLTNPPPPPRPEPILSHADAISPEQVEALRGASRQLDEIANQLEQQGLYPRADQVRGLSQEMRIDARKGPQQRSSGTPVAAPQYYEPQAPSAPPAGG